MTTIEWTDETWNPVTGCSKVSQGCKNCYAERLWPKVEAAERRREHFEWQKVTPRAFTEIRTHPLRLDAPLHWKKPRRIFVNSMSDLFHEDVPDQFILQVFDVMRQCQNGWTPVLGGEKGKLVASHTFQILTKRPQRMLDFCTRLRFAQNDGRGLYLAESLPHNGFNPMRALRNVWLGVSVEDQATADERIPLLLQTPAAVRFISAEPLLGDIRLGAWLQRSPSAAFVAGKVTADMPEWTRTGSTALDWVITGGESGPKARPSHPDWFRSLRDQCAAAMVPFFFKQWGEWWEVGHDLHEDNKPVQIDVDSGEADEWFSKGDQLIAADGHIFNSFDTMPMNTPCRLMTRIGKKAAGRTLDGRTHDDYPEAKP